MGDLDPSVNLFNVYNTVSGGIEAVGAMLPSGMVVMEFITGQQLAMKIYDDLEECEHGLFGRHIRWVGRPDAGGSAEPLVTRVFDLIRKEDITGVSGTGADERHIVACGVCLPSGRVVMQWITRGMYSLNLYPGGLTELERLHGHEGRTSVCFRKRTLMLVRNPDRKAVAS